MTDKAKFIMQVENARAKAEGRRQPFRLSTTDNGYVSVHIEEDGRVIILLPEGSLELTPEQTERFREALSEAIDDASGGMITIGFRGFDVKRIS
jgi:hypothetical protein